MMPTTEHREIRERRGASVSPVADVMTLAEPQSTAREAASAIAMMQRAPQRRRNGSRPGTDFEDPAIRIVSHHDPTRVARQTLGRFCRNVRAVVEDRLAGRISVRQHRRVDVDHDLVALARGAGIDSVVERRFGDEGQRVRLLLRHRGRLRRNVGARRFGGNALSARLLI